jgi:hypothetical protein
VIAIDTVLELEILDLTGGNGVVKDFFLAEMNSSSRTTFVMLAFTLINYLLFQGLRVSGFMGLLLCCGHDLCLRPQACLKKTRTECWI